MRLVSVIACRSVRPHSGHSCSIGRYQRLITVGYVLCRFIGLLLAVPGLLSPLLPFYHPGSDACFALTVLHRLLGFTPLGFVEASSPILLFFALFGLSMDYEVFLLSRVQEAFWQTGDNTRAVALGLQRSGAIITSAAIIVVVVSASFATADVILVKALGLGMALAVFLDATFVRALLVPATMRLLGTLNWWLPFAGVQRHPPALAEYIDTAEPEVYTAQAMQDESMKDATMGGKQ